jgi:hypothetical protein
MKVDGDDVVEIDVSAAQLSALLGAERPDGDQRGKLVQVPRPIGKTWVTRAKWEEDSTAAEAHARWTANAVGELVMVEYRP